MSEEGTTLNNVRTCTCKSKPHLPEIPGQMLKYKTDPTRKIQDSHDQRLVRDLCLVSKLIGSGQPCLSLFWLASLVSSGSFSASKLTGVYFTPSMSTRDESANPRQATLGHVCPVGAYVRTRHIRDMCHIGSTAGGCGGYVGELGVPPQLGCWGGSARKKHCPVICFTCDMQQLSPADVAHTRQFWHQLSGKGS